MSNQITLTIKGISEEDFNKAMLSFKLFNMVTGTDVDVKKTLEYDISILDANAQQEIVFDFTQNIGGVAGTTHLKKQRLAANKN